MTAFADAWSKMKGPAPTVMRGLKIRHWDEVAKDVGSGSRAKARALVESLYAGDVFVLKNAFEPAWFRRVIRDLVPWGHSREQSFHKIVEGVPDFHRCIDSTATKAYSVEAVRHGYYFFRWNGDPLDIFPTIDQRWRVLKAIGGCQPGAYEQNKPADGVIDRVIFYHYPRGGGNLGTHVDPTNNHKIIIGGLMSKRGPEFRKGGIYFLGVDGKQIDVEDCLGIGDVFIAYPTVHHGVSPVDPDVPLDWERGGRWFLGLSSVDSDHVAERVTAARVTA